jgi:hypothetical protein
LRAAFDAAYAPNPSSKERKFVVDPESDEINTSVWIRIGTVGMEGERGEAGRVDGSVEMVGEGRECAVNN